MGFLFSAPFHLEMVIPQAHCIGDSFPFPLCSFLFFLSFGYFVKSVCKNSSLLTMPLRFRHHFHPDTVLFPTHFLLSLFQKWLKRKFCGFLLKWMISNIPLHMTLKTHLYLYCLFWGATAGPGHCAASRSIAIWGLWTVWELIWGLTILLSNPETFHSTLSVNKHQER